MGTIRAAMAGMERTEILERIWNAKEEKRRTGGFGQSAICLPYGVAFTDRWSYTAAVSRVKEAFRLVSAGNTSYTSIGKAVGIEPYNLRNILRNPIYTGWRVVDKKRDLSASGKYKTKDGRQGDRRKIKRAPEEVIRVKVLDPLVSEADFNRVQRILDLKRNNSWRHIEGYEHRFTYNGYLNCRCGSIIYTKSRRDDYYICRDKCGVHYQRRDTLEHRLDTLFTKRLTSPAFLRRHVLAPLRQKRQPQGNVAQLRAQLKSLEGKKDRILETYYEGIITSEERNKRIAELEREKWINSELLAKQTPRPEVSLETLVEAFSPFQEFDLLSRDEKRRLLNTLTPSIVAANYKIEGLWIGLDCADYVNRMAADYPATARIWLPVAA